MKTCNWIMFLTAVSLYLSCFFNVSQAGLITEGGKLVGATNISVNGDLYNVTFVDDTCIDLFSGCNEIGDFFWTTYPSAQLASSALMDQVFNTSINEFYDLNPNETVGCTDLVWCSIITPFSLPHSSIVGVAHARNFNEESRDEVYFRSTNVFRDVHTRGYENFTYAVWTSASQVSEPSTITIFALGLIGFISRRFNK